MCKLRIRRSALRMGRVMVKGVLTVLALLWAVGIAQAQNDSTLIVYFSRAGYNYSVGWTDEGNTAVMGRYIKEFTGGRIFEIIPKVPYPADYEAAMTVSNKECEADARPEIKNPLNVDLKHYSTVFIGSGVWAGQPPMIMRTFYETYREQLRGKRIIPFGTHEGSGIATLVTNIRKYLKDVKVESNALGLYGHEVRSSQNAVSDWLRKIGFTPKARPQRAVPFGRRTAVP